MAAVRRSLLLAPSLVLAPALVLGTGGLVSAAAAPRPARDLSPLTQVEMSGDAAQGLIDRVLAHSLVLQPPGRSTIKEIGNLNTVVPFAQKWKQAIARRDVAAAKQAGEDYEAAWQAVEVYINHRSLPLYTSIEVDTQFVIDDGLNAQNPDWRRLSDLADSLRKQLSVAIDFIAAQPALSPIFDDLVPLRGVRAQLLISRDALTKNDVAKAKTFYDKFKAGYNQSVADLIKFRSTAAAGEIQISSDALGTKFNDPTATAAQLTPLLTTLLDRLGYGVNLTNAAARAADLHKATFTDADKTALTQLKTVAQDLKNGPSPVAGATGPGSPFADVQPALEAKARLVNTAATLRSALAAYASSPSDQRKKTALEAVALAQQTFVGQFWGDPGLQPFLIPLP
jgi:hypothetical protein